jgi:hypothetical protein
LLQATVAVSGFVYVTRASPLFSPLDAVYSFNFLIFPYIENNEAKIAARLLLSDNRCSQAKKWGIKLPKSNSVKSSGKPLIYILALSAKELMEDFGLDSKSLAPIPI